MRDFSCRILRGDKVGVIGPNGAGKTTLLRLILGELQPDTGTVRRGTRVSVAYYDQFRAQLDEEASVLDTVGQGSDYVEVGGERKHVMSYLGDFLFSPERVRSPVKSLSGGERNRLLLARLFTRPANLLVLDEPTNDLDIETLELLEALLQEYAGTVLLVSHDRVFLDNVVTQVIAFDGDATWLENPGGYQEWARVLRARARGGRTAGSEREPAARADSPRARAPKLSWKEQQELKELPARIEALEREQGELARQLADPGLLQFAAGPDQADPRAPSGAGGPAADGTGALDRAGSEGQVGCRRSARRRRANVCDLRRARIAALVRAPRCTGAATRNCMLATLAQRRILLPAAIALCLPALARAGQEALNVDTAADATAQEESPLQRSFQPGPLIQGVNAVTDLLRSKLKDMPAFFRDTVVTFKPRTYYLNQDRPDGTHSEAWTLGGSLEYVSGRFRDRFQIGAELFTSQPLYAPDDADGTLLLKPGQEGYTVLGQLYAKLRLGGRRYVTLGRREFSTPYVNRQFNRMTPNTFEAIALKGSFTPLRRQKFDYEVGYLSKVKLRNSDTFIPMSQAVPFATEDAGRCWRRPCSRSTTGHSALPTTTRPGHAQHLLRGSDLEPGRRLGRKASSSRRQFTDQSEPSGAAPRSTASC